MNSIGQYIFSVTAAALVCSIARKLIGKNGTAAQVGKMMTGVFMALAILGPMVKLEWGNLTDWTEDHTREASKAVAAGQEQSNTALSEIIKERTAAYILEKAESLGLEIEVFVTVSKDEIPLPSAVRIRGKTSPYAKTRLQDILETDLGIPKEKQTWI